MQPTTKEAFFAAICVWILDTYIYFLGRMFCVQLSVLMLCFSSSEMGGKIVGYFFLGKKHVMQ